MDKKKIFLSTLLVIGIVLLAIGFFVGGGTEAVTAGGTLVPKTDNIKEYDVETKTVTLKDKDDKELATIRLLTPLNNKVGLGYQRIAEYEVTGKVDIKADFFGEVLTYDKVKYDNDDLISLNKVIDLKYKTTEDYSVDDYACLNSTSVNGTTREVCEVSGSHIEQREVWLDFDEKTRPGKDEKIIIGLYTTTYQGEVGEWIQYFAGVPVEEWAEWTASLDVNLISYWAMEDISGTINDSTGNHSSIEEISIEYNLIGRVNNAINTTTDVDGQVGFGLQTDFFNQGERTLGCWFNTNETITDGTIMGSFTRAGASLYWGESLYIGSGGTFGLRGGTGGEGGGNFASGKINQYLGTTDITDGLWHLVLLRFDTLDFEIWVDGKNELNQTLGNRVVYDNTYSTFNIGGWEADSDTAWQGTEPSLYDECFYYNRSLSVEEIQQYYNNGDGITFPGDEIINCQFSGFVKDENGDALVGANVTIWNQFDVTEFYEDTTIAGGEWTINVSNSTNTYMVGAYFNNTLIGQLKPFISGTC